MKLGIRRWSRADVDLTDWWEHRGEIYKTVGLIDHPVIVVENMTTGRKEYHVIHSPNFAQFKRLRPESTALAEDAA